MSGPRNSISENQASASENESDRLVSVGKQHASSSQNKPSQANQSSDDSHSPHNNKKQLSALSVSTSHLYQTEGSYDDVSSSDGITIRNTSSTSSDKESGMCQELEGKQTLSSSTPSVVLNSVSSSVSSLNNSNNAKDDSFEKFADNQSATDGICNTSPSSVSQESSLFPDNLSRSSESGKSVDLGSQKSPETHASKSDVRIIEKVRSTEKKEKKKSSWYSNMLNPSYKSKSDDFKRLFKDLPDAERLIVDYSCALQKDILVHGRLYVSQNYFCFYANIFRWETFVLIRCSDITSITKEKTARVIPNAIQITTNTEKLFFTSFGARDKTFLMLFRIWQNALLEQPMSSQELWQWVHFSYGEELGLTSDDDDYVPPIIEEDLLKGKHSDQNMKCIEKRLDKIDMNLFESASDVLIEEDILESASEMNGNCEIMSVENAVEEDSATKTPDESKSVMNKKSTDYPTDMSDTTESEDNIEEIEFACPCISHEGKEMLNAVFPMSVDQVFSLIFTGSKFYYDLLESRKTYDIMESPWQLCPEFDLKMRQVTYTITLNHAMAKSAQTTETQRLLKHSKPGQVYTVDCDVVNTGIPYSDAFTVKSVYCLTSVSKKECRLRISGCVKYKKNVWGIVKSLIEKSAVQGLADFATDLANALQKEAEMSSQQSLAKKTRRRKRMKFDSIKCDNLKDTPRSLQRQPTIRNIGPSISSFDLASLGSTPDVVIRVILITLVILLFLNMLLFYKLWSLEDQSSKQAPPSAWDYPDSQSTLTKEDYIHLLQKQDALHRAETERWRDALSEVIKLIHLIEKSLSELKSSIDTYSSTSVLKVLALRMTQNSDDGSSEDTSSKINTDVQPDV